MAMQPPQSLLSQIKQEQAAPTEVLKRITAEALGKTNELSSIMALGWNSIKNPIEWIADIIQTAGLKAFFIADLGNLTFNK